MVKGGGTKGDGRRNEAGVKANSSSKHIETHTQRIFKSII
jgi:hypothetical protein